MDEKTIRFINRTMGHIHRVQNNIVTLVTKYSYELDLTDDNIRFLMFLCCNHDRSKFSRGQWDGYVALTEYFHQRKVLGNKDYEYPDSYIKAKAEYAITNHYKSETHHPEGLVPPVDGWTICEALECASDLCAMAEEFGEEGSGYKYYNHTWKEKSEPYFTPANFMEVRDWMTKAFQCFEIENYGRNKNL